MSLARVRLNIEPESGGPPDLRVDGKSLDLRAVTEIRLNITGTDGAAELRVVYGCQGVDIVGKKVSIRHVCPIRGTL